MDITPVTSRLALVRAGRGRARLFRRDQNSEKPLPFYVQHDQRSAPVQPLPVFAQNARPAHFKPSPTFVQQDCLASVKKSTAFSPYEHPAPLKPSPTFAQNERPAPVKPSSPAFAQHKCLAPVKPSPTFAQQERPAPEGVAENETVEERPTQPKVRSWPRLSKGVMSLIQKHLEQRETSTPRKVSPVIKPVRAATEPVVSRFGRGRGRAQKRQEETAVSPGAITRDSDVSDTTPHTASETAVSPGATTYTSDVSNTNTAPDTASETAVSPGATTYTSDVSNTNTAPDTASETAVSPGATTYTSDVSNTNTAPNTASETAVSPGATTHENDASIIALPAAPDLEQFLDAAADASSSGRPEAPVSKFSSRVAAAGLRLKNTREEPVAVDDVDLISPNHCFVFDWAVAMETPSPGAVSEPPHWYTV